MRRSPDSLLKRLTVVRDDALALLDQADALLARHMALLEQRMWLLFDMPERERTASEDLSDTGLDR
jgi:hypothetical protein